MKARIIGPSDEPVRRVVGRVVREREHGYIDISEVRYNILLERTPILGGLLHVWKEVDREVVPDHASISLGCFGDTGGWRSRFQAYMPVRNDRRVAVSA